MRELRIVGAARASEIAATVVRLDTLEELLGWCSAHRSELVEVIVQDEYTHDVIVRGAAAYLCFDTT